MNPSSISPSSAPIESPNSHIPGSLGIPYIGHTFHFFRDAIGFMNKKQQKYGDVFQIRMLGNRIICLCGSTANKFVLVEQGAHFESQEVWEDPLSELFPNGLMLMDGERHKYHRSILRAAFTKDALTGYLEIMPTVIFEHFDRWKGQSALHAFPEMKRLTLRLAGRVFFGLDFSDQLSGINRSIIELVKAATTLPINLPFTPYGKGIRGRKRLEAYFKEIIHEKRNSEGKDLFSLLFRVKNEEGAQLTEQQIIDHLIFILMAAHDTTASSLSSLCYLLAKHPEWQERLRLECQEMDLRKPFDMKELRKHSLMGLAINETLRLYPPLILIPRKATKDMVFDGYKIPKGAYINLLIQHHHRKADVWDNPQEFDPDRFVLPRREDAKCPHMYAPFGAGAHHCLGFSFAELQIRMIMTEMLQRFEWAVPKAYEAKYQAIPLQEPKDGLPISLKER
ncbi:MAG: cytochrome P450 [Bacteroidota bacterium]